MIKVHAASVNSFDLGLLSGTPFVIRLIASGLFKPKYKILGGDIAGRVEGVGRNVKQFQPGDEVFGDLIEFVLGTYLGSMLYGIMREEGYRKLILILLFLLGILMIAQ